MLCINLLLSVIVSCSARELSTLATPEEFNLNIVQLSTQKPESGSRIIGGTATTIENYPYTVQVLYFMQFICAGSLLTSRHVLSAAHCFVDDHDVVASPRSFAIRVGTSNLNSGGSVHYVSAIVVHENYNEPTHNNDVAMVLLGSSVTLSNSVQTARIPEAEAELPDDNPVVAVGWGRTIANIQSSSSRILNEVTVRTVNHQVCTRRYAELEVLTRDPYPVTDNMLCAGLLDIGGADACQGDSGGPLLYSDIVVGITSWGYSCGLARYPGVYAQVSRYTTWINQTVTRFNGSSSNHSSLALVLISLALIIVKV